MPEVAIRPAGNPDLPELLEIVPSYLSSRVWQVDRLADEGILTANFREVRLPREARMEYPRSPVQMLSGLDDPHETVLLAEVAGEAVGYIRISDQMALRTGWVKDVVVLESLRRKGIGSALVSAGLDWSVEQGFRRVVIETQSKNFPAIQLARRLGFEFAGFSDQFYSNQDIALFFGRSLR